MNKLNLIACGVVSLLLTGCGANKTSENVAPKDEPAKSAGASAAVNDPNAGSISGNVNFTGAKPAVKAIDMAANPACASTHGTPAVSEEVIVNNNGTLKYAFVWVKSGIAEKTWQPPSSPAVLDQKGCMYTPHVIGVMVNQEVKFVNSDATNHNIHPLPRVNEEWNESEPPNGEPKLKRFVREEIMVPVKCNIHPWMRAWIGVVSHPFFAVTGEDGSFKLKGVPAGKYTLAAWHEKYGTKEFEVVVAPKEDKIVNFDYKPE
jgi:plastocyanin